ncbi:hypothetical protein AAZX31_10G094000 [Glycine max]
MIQTGVNNTHPPHASIVNNISSFENLPWQLHFIHTLCEGNVCVDLFAKARSSSQQSLIVLESFLHFLLSSLRADELGTIFIHF